MTMSVGDFCNLDGVIPDSLGELVHLTKISLYFNNIVGPLPDGTHTHAYTRMHAYHHSEWAHTVKYMAHV